MIGVIPWQKVESRFLPALGRKVLLWVTGQPVVGKRVFTPINVTNRKTATDAWEVEGRGFLDISKATHWAAIHGPNT